MKWNRKVEELLSKMKLEEKMGLTAFQSAWNLAGLNHPFIACGITLFAIEECYNCVIRDDDISNEIC